VRAQVWHRFFHSLEMRVYAVVDDSLSPTFPLCDALGVYVRREDAERFIEVQPGEA
jgi:hypothetical protein